MDEATYDRSAKFFELIKLKKNFFYHGVVKLSFVHSRNSASAGLDLGINNILYQSFITRLRRHSSGFFFNLHYNNRMVNEHIV